MVTGAFTIFAAIDAIFIQVPAFAAAELTVCATQHIVDALHKSVRPTVERMQR
jgi:hypothetical protein